MTRIFTGEHGYEWLHLVKIIIAIMISYWATVLIFQQSHLWTLVTVVVIMGPEMNLASHIQRSIARVVGTLLGALLGALVLSLHFSHELDFPIVMGVSFMLLYLGILKTRWTMAGVLGLVTFFMVALTPHADWHLAFERALEIILGVGIVLAVSLIFYPINSTHIIDRLMKSNAQLLSRLVVVIAVEKKLRFESDELEQLHKRFVRNIEQLRQAINQMSYGGQGRKKAQKEAMLLRMTACYRYINYIEVTYRTHLLPEAPCETLALVDRFERLSAMILEKMFVDLANGLCIDRALQRFAALRAYFDHASLHMNQNNTPDLVLALQAMQYTHLRLLRVLTLLDLSFKELNAPTIDY